MAQDLKDLLRKEGVDPKCVLVLRHAPTKHPKLRAALPSLAKYRPDVFNAYQATQPPRVEGSMAKAAYVAAFIGHQPGKAVFVGLYRNRGGRKVVGADLLKMGAYQELLKIDEDDSFTRPSSILFDLERLDLLSEHRGQLVIQWPPTERSWYRWADKNHFVVDSTA